MIASELSKEGVDLKSVQEALSGVDVHKWLEAMEAEISNIEEKTTWVETTLPAGRKAIGWKWVFKVKEDGDGQVIKYKARYSRPALIIFSLGSPSPRPIVHGPPPS
jgi:hypothetical protein